MNLWFVIGLLCLAVVAALAAIALWVDAGAWNGVMGGSIAVVLWFILGWIERRQDRH